MRTSGDGTVSRLSPMAARVHLVRHGEVLNPDHVVYAGLPGFGLSDGGRAQAKAAARYLGGRPIVAVWSSPLERALRTAEALATRVGLPVRVDPALAEWGLMDRWAGVSWQDLPERYPGELEAYLEHPAELAFSPESLSDLAERAATSIRRLERSHPHGELAVVSHSATVRAAVLALTGNRLETYWEEEPAHGSVTTLRPGPSWTVETTWHPSLEEGRLGS